MKLLPNHGNASRTSGFTIVELLISMTVIFILITTAVVAFRSVRKSAARTEPLSALRQMMVAYNAYAQEHKGRLMPGYIDPDELPEPGPLPPLFTGLDIRAKLPHHVPDTQYNEVRPGDAASYVWRLAPYLDYAWPTMMAEYSSSLVSQLRSEYEERAIYGAQTAGGVAFGIAQVPCFGLNSIYLGGDSYHGDQAANPAPWNGGKLAATRLGQVKSAGTLVVFASCAVISSQATVPPYPPFGPSANTSEVLGYAALRPPQIPPSGTQFIATGSEWNHEGETINYIGTGQAGLPVDRFADAGKQHAVEGTVSVGHLDGSVGKETIARLAKDMSRWSPFIVGGSE